MTFTSMKSRAVPRYNSKEWVCQENAAVVANLWHQPSENSDVINQRQGYAGYWATYRVGLEILPINDVPGIWQVRYQLNGNQNLETHQCKSYQYNVVKIVRYQSVAWLITVPSLITTDWCKHNTQKYLFFDVDCPYHLMQKLSCLQEKLSHLEVTFQLMKFLNLMEQRSSLIN